MAERMRGMGLRPHCPERFPSFRKHLLKAYYHAPSTTPGAGGWGLEGRQINHSPCPQGAHNLVTEDRHVNGYLHKPLQVLLEVWAADKNFGMDSI